MSKTLIEHSKTMWNTGTREPDTQELILGCQQRIASATEAMAGNYLRLQKDLETYKRWYNEEVAKNHKAAKQIAAYQGHIKRMKKQSIKQ